MTKTHRKFVASHHCLVCMDGDIAPAGWVLSHCAHVKYNEPGSLKKGAREARDHLTVPLCPWHHTDGPDAQHKSNERDWWENKGIDPVAKALELAKTSPCKKTREAAKEGSGGT